MKNIVVTGSVAYDHLLTFDGEFKDSLIKERLDNLSLSFTASSHKTDFGGCGANIAFTLSLLGDNPVLFAVAGNDFAKYHGWLYKNRISTEQVSVDESTPTAVATVLSDKKQNQLAIFSPAAIETHPIEIELKGVDFSKMACAIIAPELPARMVYLADYFKKNGLAYIFDPGQSIPALSKDDLLRLIDDAEGMILNEYEAEMLMSKLGLNIDEIAENAGFLIKTTGEKGCELYEKGALKHVGAVSGLDIADVTGCGDAFRAGFLHGFVNNEKLVRACEMANVAASFAIEKEGTQNHRFSMEEFNDRLQKTYS